MEVLRRLDSLRYKRPAIFVVSGRRHDDMNDSSEKQFSVFSFQFSVRISPTAEN
jgi:hypothetical protein